MPPYEAFFSKLRNNNPLDKDFIDYDKLEKSGFDEQQALKKLQIKTVRPSGLDNYKFLQETWKKIGMTVFKDFFKWYNNKDVAPTLEAMQKMIQFYHNKGIDMLKLGCTHLNLANTCLHKSTNYKFYPFCESDKDLCEKIREDMTGGPSIVFTRKAVVDETYIRNSSNVCKSIENMVMSLYRETRPECKIEGFFTSGKQKKSTVLMWTVIVITVRQCLKQWMLLPLLFLSRSSAFLNRTGYWARKQEERDGWHATRIH